MLSILNIHNWGKIFFHPSSEMKNRGVFQQTRLSFESHSTIKFCFSFKVRSNFNFTFNFEMRFHESASLNCNCISTLMGTVGDPEPLGPVLYFNMSGSGEHPSHFMVVGMAACETC